jgi:YfiH family protein
MAKIVNSQVPYLSFDLFSSDSLIAAVSTRKGGVSKPPFDEMDMGYNNGDDPKDVFQNRKLFLSSLGIDANRTVGCQQVHGVHIAEATHKDWGMGSKSYDTGFPDTDGLITKEKQVPITMNFADCTPLLFYDPKQEVIAVAHGGWRGTAGNIAGKMIHLMTEKYHSNVSDIVVGIGPAIGPESFEVGEDVIDAFSKLFTKDVLDGLYTKKPNGKFLFNLPKANTLLLEQAGVLPNHIENCGIDTMTHDDLFFSYRKHHGVTGRHMAVMMLK